MAGGAGRLVLGLGAGWQENEHAQYGIDLPPLPQRVDRFAEVCAITRSLLDGTTTDFSGRWFTLSGALCEPKPLQHHLPLLIGAKGDRMLRLVARFADEWNMWGLPKAVAERGAALDRRCESIGRDPATVARSTQALVMLTEDESTAIDFVEAVAPRAAVAGTPSRIAETVAAWEAAGIDEVIVPDFVLGSGRRKLEALDALAEAFTPFR